MTANRTERASGLPPQLLRRGFGVLRPADAKGVYADPPKEFLRLANRGLLHKLATGYYAIVPADSTDRTWLPGLEAAAFGIAAADYGVRSTALMGVSAARLHGAIPRALAVAVVTAEKYRPPLTLADRDAHVVFVRRNPQRLDTERLSTDLGGVLVTTIEQTLLDLAHRPELGGVPDEARVAVRALAPRADGETLERLASTQRLRAALRRARGWVAE